LPRDETDLALSRAVGVGLPRDETDLALLRAVGAGLPRDETDSALLRAVGAGLPRDETRLSTIAGKDAADRGTSPLPQCTTQDFSYKAWRLRST